MDPIVQLYRDTRERFPTIVEATDRKHLETWELNDEDAYMWFHSLADTLNAQMRTDANLNVAGAIFDYMRHRFATGGAEVRNCIDVAFVENLFWRVSPAHAEAYWARMPDLLKSLYLGFHASPPCGPGGRSGH